MSVLWVSRGLTAVVGLLAYILLRYERVWEALTWFWTKARRILLAIFLAYVLNLAMAEVFEARPDLYKFVETGIDSIIVSISSGLYATGCFVLKLFSNKALDYFLYGFNVTTNKQVTP